MALAAGDARHGTSNGYINLRCRCQPCRDAFAVHMRAMRASRKSRLGGDGVQPKHGLHTTYENWCCRCQPCREAHSAYRVAAEAKAR